MTDHMTNNDLADLVERYAAMIVADLRASPDQRSDRSSAEPPARVTDEGEKGRQTMPPSMWSKVGELTGQTYKWPAPTGTEGYDPFEVWESLGRPSTQIGLGKSTNHPASYGKSERGYWVAFQMVNGQKRRPIAVFNEADDYEQTRAVLAVIKGKGESGREMFRPGDELPPGYAQLDIAVFRDRINGPQAFNGLAVVASEANPQDMCTHALLQLDLRPA
jgi:hypothetical protein